MAGKGDTAKVGGRTCLGEGVGGAGEPAARERGWAAKASLRATTGLDHGQGKSPG